MCLAHSVTKDLFEKFRRTGANVIIPEFPGYGMSGGRATEKEFFATADAVYNYLKSRQDIDTNQIIVAGWSMGSGTAIDLASRENVAGLIAVGAFTNLQDVGRPNLPWYARWLTPALSARCQFDNLGKIHAVSCPIFLMYGSRDQLVPPAMADRLTAASTSNVTRFEVEGAQHEDIWTVGGPSVWRAIEGWMTSLKQVRADSGGVANEKQPNHSTEPTPTSGASAAEHPPRQP
jgi:pimeloyl-ACP methyl ester carboxylesterase